MNTLAIGVDIGGTRTKIGIVDLRLAKIITMFILPTEKKDAKAFLNNIQESVQQLLAVEKIKKQDVRGIGFGVPGFVFENGVVDSTYGFLEFMEDYPLVQLVEAKCHLECRLDNDARVVALGEALYGEAKYWDRVLVLTLGTGLGVGFVVNKKLDGRLPHSHMAGHISISANGADCYCGKRGCLESLVSATGIVGAAIGSGWAESHPGVEINAKTIFKTAFDGNKYSKEIIFTTMQHLKRGIGNYINIYAPDIIIIGGGVAKGMRPYLPMFNDEHILGPFKNYKANISLSTLDEHSGVLGSAALFND